MSASVKYSHTALPSVRSVRPFRSNHVRPRGARHAQRRSCRSHAVALLKLFQPGNDGDGSSVEGTNAPQQAGAASPALSRPATGSNGQAPGGFLGILRSLFDVQQGKLRAGRPAALDDLLRIVEETDRGLTLDSQQKEQIDAAVQRLKQESTVTSLDNLSATWRLLYTSEKETLFILQRAWFGAKATDVYQAIDLEQDTLQNVISFDSGARFLVNSSVRQTGQQRIAFKFKGARLSLPSWSLPLPPFGQGWFDNIYIDDTYRVAYDSRGDTLVCVRDGPPRDFN